MATRAIVPNADGEGSVGKPTLQWGDIQTKKINDLSFPSTIEEGSKSKALVVNSTEDGFEIGSAISEGGGGGFFTIDIESDLTPLPFGSEYVQPIVQDIRPGDAGKVIVVNEDETAFEIFRTPLPIIPMQIGDAGKVIVVTSNELGYEHKSLSLAHSLNQHQTCTLSQLNTIISDNNLASESSVTALNNNKVDKTISVIAGNGLTGGGALSANSTLTLGTPSSCSTTTTNSLTSNSHTHAITGVIKYTATKEAGTLYSGTTAPTNANRLNYDGYFYATRVYNAVYNDYAECFKAAEFETIPKNRIVKIIDDKVYLSTPESSLVIGIVSDSYGFMLHGSEEEIKSGLKIPVGMSGTLFVDSEKIPVDNNDVGKFVCSGEDGKARVIPKGEAYKYEGCIVGKIIGIDFVKNQYKVLISIK